METIFQSVPQYVITCVVVFAAQVIYSLFGFGSGIFTVSILAFFFNDLSSLVILVLLLSLPAEIFIVLKTRKSIRTGNIFLLVTGLFFGIFFGNRLLILRERINLFIFMGVLLCIFSLYFIFLENRVKPRRINRTWTFIIGLISGITSATFSMGGPPIILYYRFLNPPKAEFRVNLLAIFFITSCIRTPLYVFDGLLTSAHLLSALIVIPFVVSGIFAGYKLHLNIDEARFRRITSYVIFVLGFMLLFK